MNTDANTDKPSKNLFLFLPPGEATDRLIPDAGQGDEGSGPARLRGLCWPGHWGPSLI